MVIYKVRFMNTCDYWCSRELKLRGIHFKFNSPVRTNSNLAKIQVPRFQKKTYDNISQIKSG